jgi:hypothetical protein
VQGIAGFPPLAAEGQSLVQMGTARGMILVGVRDDEDGKKQSGWILVDSGVGNEEHGDHGHSTYQLPPRIRATRLDEKQGNPAHLYVYDNIFYLANDKLAGYTRIDPAAIRPADSAAAIIGKSQFIPGGGGHITLAAFNRTVGYSTWIDREGDNKGRVDVTPFGKPISYSLKLPSGGLHGATANGGKVFFAPMDGICWVSGDATGSLGADAVKVQHLSLGKNPDDDKPIRTGSFTNFGKHVLFTTGAGPQAELQWLDASASEPKIEKLPLLLADGRRPVGPMAATINGRFPMALVFHDRPADADGEEHVSLIELDPNLDGVFTDACVAKVLKVGASKVDGHAGHHDAVFLSDAKHAAFTNPGDGTIGLLRVRRMEQVGSFQVGGAPSKIEAIGNASGH